MESNFEETYWFDLNQYLLDLKSWLFFGADKIYFFIEYFFELARDFFHNQPTQSSPQESSKFSSPMNTPRENRMSYFTLFSNHDSETMYFKHINHSDESTNPSHFKG